MEMGSRTFQGDREDHVGAGAAADDCLDSPRYVCGAVAGWKKIVRWPARSDVTDRGGR